MTADFSDPASVVQAFIVQMHYWQGLAGSLRGNAQVRFNPAKDSTMHPEELRVSQLLRLIPPVISDIFLSKQRRAVAPGGSYSFPPEYDPTTEAVVRVVPKTKTQVIVETERKANYMGGL